MGWEMGVVAKLGVFWSKAWMCLHTCMLFMVLYLALLAVTAKLKAFNLSCPY